MPKRDKNCDQCEDVKGCAKCHEKFFSQVFDEYSEDKKCTLCDPNCKKCIDDKGCTECNSRYYPSYNKSMWADGCYACKEGCIKCDERRVCSLCGEGYQSYGSLCFACSLPNCKSCPTHMSTCTECKDGYNLVSIFGINQKCSGSNGLSYGKIMIILLVLFVCCVAGVMVNCYMQSSRTPVADINPRTEDTFGLTTEDNITTPLN